MAECSLNDILFHRYSLPQTTTMSITTLNDHAFKSRSKFDGIGGYLLSFSSSCEASLCSSSCEARANDFRGSFYV